MTMQETIMQKELNNIHLSKIAALQQKRTIAFVNHFVMTNVQFLNNFMRNCETKLMQFEHKLEKVSAAMVLLESKLSSIPEVNMNTPKPEPKVETPPELPEKTQEAEPQSEVPNSVEKENTNEKNWPDYDRFVKMVQVGVPLQAVKLKVSLEGLDPNILDEILTK